MSGFAAFVAFAAAIASGSNPIQRWAFATGGAVDSSPVLSNDGAVLYAFSDDGNLYSVNASTGAGRWSFPTGGGSGAGKQGYNPVLSLDDMIVYIKNDHLLYAVNTFDGTQLWGIPLGGFNGGSPALSSDGSTIFAGGCLGGNCSYLFAFDALTGSKVWGTAVASGLLSPAVGSDGNVVYAGSSHNNALYALQSSDGAKLWSVAGGMSSPAVSTDGTTVYVGSWDWSLRALSTTNGSTLWAGRNQYLLGFTRESAREH